VVAIFIALEIGAVEIYQRTRGREFVRDEVLGRLIGERSQPNPIEKLPPELAHKVAELKDAAIPDTPVILHPFFGFVANPESPGVNGYGFFQAQPLVRDAADRVLIVIFGGSLADQVFYMAKDVLVERLAASPEFQGREIEVRSTALGGVKQPQQLNILSFMLGLGAEYDYVVNIDGFNEVDSSTENFYDGISPYYPHNWKLHARRGLNPQAMMRLGKIEIIRERRKQLRQRFADWSILRRMNFFLVLWDLMDGRELNALRRESTSLREILAEAKLPPRVAGPPHQYEREDELYGDLADLWARSSIQMDAVSERFGVRYLHFLQPNQYVPDSKVFTEEEQRVAYDEGFIGVDRIPRTYPLLVERAAALRDQGVHFVDLTGLFEDERRTVYSDFCCHVNELGAQLIAERIAGEILSESS